MNLRVALGGVVALIVSVYTVVAILSAGKSQPTLTQSAGENDGNYKATVAEGDPPPISPTGPHPKAIIDATEFEFGRMEVGEERSHVFTLRNEGSVPLVIKKGASTCQCTLSELEKGELPAGESMKVTLKWKPTAQAENFRKSADIMTNDPDHQLITLQLKGMVVPRLLSIPNRDWLVNKMADDEPTVFTGMLISPLVEKFEILGLESQNPLLSAEATPLDPEQLTLNRAVSGYEIKVKLSSEIPVGPFTIPLAIKTDVPERTAEGTLGGPSTVEVLVSGTHRGPVRIIGQAWDENHMAITMGQFEQKQGRTTTLTMMIRGAPEEGLKIIGEPVCDPEQLQATIESDEKALGKHARFKLKLEYPAGAPRVNRREANPATVRFRTNHPRAPEVELLVYFTAI